MVGILISLNLSLAVISICVIWQPCTCKSTDGVFMISRRTLYIAFFVLKFSCPFVAILYPIYHHAMDKNSLLVIITHNYLKYTFCMHIYDFPSANLVVVWDKCLARPPLTHRYITFGHCSDVIMDTMASQITSLAIVYLTVYSAQIKQIIKAPRHWPWCGEFTGDRWIPRTNGQ